MNLTDLIPPRQWHKLAHQQIDTNRDNRCERIRDAYSKDVIQCLTQCGTSCTDPKTEYMLIMSTMALLDHMIEQVTKKVQ
jgi:hypothetical protein